MAQGSSAGQGDALEEMVRSEAWVRSLPGGCVYGDGYRCREAEAGGAITVPGPYLDAWRVAYTDFLGLSELTGEQKALHHYEIAFGETPSDYIVEFRALLMPHIVDGEPVDVMQATFGRTTRYRIDRETLEIRERLFAK